MRAKWRNGVGKGKTETVILTGRKAEESYVALRIKFLFLLMPVLTNGRLELQ